MASQIFVPEPLPRATIDAVRKGGPGPATNPPPRVRGLVRLWSRESAPPLTVTAEHHKLPQVLDERAGGWKVVERQGQLAATTWTGSPPLRLALVLMLDGKTRRIKPISVQDGIDDIRRLGYKVASLKRTPAFTVIGAVPYAEGGPSSGPATVVPDWVLEKLNIEVLDTTENGRPSQAIATLTLLEHVPTTIEQEKLKAAADKLYTWQRGDTVPSVALEQLGDDRRAQWIRDANPKLTRLGWTKVKPGTKVIMPAKAPKA